MAGNPSHRTYDRGSRQENMARHDTGTGNLVYWSHSRCLLRMTRLQKTGHCPRPGGTTFQRAGAVGKSRVAGLTTGVLKAMMVSRVNLAVGALLLSLAFR